MSKLNPGNKRTRKAKCERCGTDIIAIKKNQYTWTTLCAPCVRKRFHPIVVKRSDFVYFNE